MHMCVHVCVCVRERERERWLAIRLGILCREQRDVYGLGHVKPMLRSGCSGLFHAQSAFPVYWECARVSQCGVSSHESPAELTLKLGARQLSRVCVCVCVLGGGGEIGRVCVCVRERE